MDQMQYLDAIRQKYSLDEKRNIIIIGTPGHGNLGDHAIWYATEQILHTAFPDANIVDITIDDFRTDIEGIYYLIHKEDLIILQGGGNLGNYYMDDEMIRRYVIARFWKNRIILFPQTAYFTKNESGKTELWKSAQIYGLHPCLTLIARDDNSKKTLQEHFRNPVFRLPDVVLTLDKPQAAGCRKGVLLCLRDDAESTLTVSSQKKVEALLRQRYDLIKQSDTAVKHSIDKYHRKQELVQKWAEFGSAELVVTDRLHGLIFSVITDTPCVVLPNFNTKVTSAFKELAQYARIQMIHNADQLNTAIDHLLAEAPKSWNAAPFKALYLNLLQQLADEGNEVFPQGKDNQLYLENVLEAAGYWSRNFYETLDWFEKLKIDYAKESAARKEAQQQLTDYQVKYSELENWHEQLKSSYTDISQKHESLSRELTVCNDELAKYHEVIDGYKKLFEQQNRELNDFRQAYAQKTQELDQLGQKHAQKMQELDQLGQRYAQKTQELDQLGQKYEQQRQELENMWVRDDDWRERLLTMQEKYDALTAHCKALEKNKGDL